MSAVRRSAASANAAPAGTGCGCAAARGFPLHSLCHSFPLGIQMIEKKPVPISLCYKLETQIVGELSTVAKLKIRSLFVADCC